MLNDKTFYCLTLEDYTLPISSPDIFMYFATMETITAWANDISNNEVLRSRYKNLLNALTNYDSEPEAQHVISGQRVQILRPMKALACSEQALPSYKWNYTSYADGVFPLKCKSADISQVILEADNKIYRCVKASFEELDMLIQCGGWFNVFDSHNGVPNMLICNDDIIETRMFVCAQVYDSSELSKAIEDMNHPGTKELICASHDVVGAWASLA